MQRQYIAPLIIVLAVFALYGGFLYSPVVFDDTYFFYPGAPERFLANIGFYPRHMALATLALTWKWLGSGLLAFRVQGMLLHAGVAVALYFFLRQVQKSLKYDSGNPSKWLPLLAALVFALHPVAVYGAGYLIQRTTVMATLFALLSWIFILRGLQAGQQRWLWWSVVAYALSVLNKEHAVMVPAVGAALALWWWHTQESGLALTQYMHRSRFVLVAYGALGLLVMLYQRGLLGAAYEPEAADLLSGVVPAHVWPLSLITQGLLFFKYLALWLVPNPLWMSADMREPFASGFMVWPQTFGFALFLLWPIASLYLLARGGRRGLVGFAMLSPWLLFATELVSVRYKEIFVLYRSYLWLSPAFVLFLVFEQKLRARVVIALLIIFPLFLFPLSWNRLTTFSHPFLLWNDAARLIAGKTGVSGRERIYIDRGVELHRLKKYDLAVLDYTRAISIRADYAPAYGGRASAYAESGHYDQAFPDFDAAIKIQPESAIYYANKAKALEAVGRLDESRENYSIACKLGWELWCEKAQEMKTE